MKEELQILKVLRILKRENKMVKSEDIAKEINLSDRAVRRYCVHIQRLGYNIKCTRGKNGGYMLISERIDENEWNVIENKLKDHPDIFKKIKDAYLNYI